MFVWKIVLAAMLLTTAAGSLGAEETKEPSSDNWAEDFWLGRSNTRRLQNEALRKENELRQLQIDRLKREQNAPAIRPANAADSCQLIYDWAIAAVDYRKKEVDISDAADYLTTFTRKKFELSDAQSVQVGNVIAKTVLAAYTSPAPELMPSQAHTFCMMSG